MPNDQSENGSPEHLSFEEAYKQLEETAQLLETGTLNLEEAADLFEKGINLAQICNRLLTKTELRITRLQTSFNEQIQLLNEVPGDDNLDHPRDPAEDGQHK